MENVLIGKEIDIHGDGLQTRSFTYIDDTVDGIVRAIETPQAVGEMFNIGNDQEITILELARTINRLAGKPDDHNLRLVPYAAIGKGPYEDVRRRIPDRTKARTRLGHEGRVGLDEGLRRTFEWVKAQPR